MEIYLVRHGEKEKGDDLSLTDKGVTQSAALAKRLSDKCFDLVYSSEMIRSKETARIVSEKLDCEVVSDKRLNEFRLSMIKKDKVNWFKEETVSYNNLLDFLNKLTSKKGEDISVLIIAHGVTNRIIMSYLLELPMNNIVRFEQKETGISSLYWIEKFNNWRVEYWNDSNHLN